MHKRKEENSTTINNTEHALSEYIPCEMFLESTGFFSPSSNRIKTVFSKEKTLRRKDLSGNVEEGLISVRAIHDVGLPSTFDQDLYRAFLKICDESVSPEGKLTQPLEVPIKKLLRYANKKSGTKVIAEVKNWFIVMTGTHLIGEVYNAETKQFERIGSGVFDTYIMRGQKNKSGEISTSNEVYVSEWFLRNYEAKFFRFFDLNFYNSLKKHISKALVPLLESGWYASSGRPYRKSYRILCEEFLIKNWDFLSCIRDQLDPAQEELQKVGFLKSWEYKSTRNNDVIITWTPGRKWFDDQKARTRRKIAHKKLNEKDQRIIENRKTFQQEHISANFAIGREDLYKKLSVRKENETP